MLSSLERDQGLKCDGAELMSREGDVDSEEASSEKPMLQEQMHSSKEGKRMMLG